MASTFLITSWQIGVDSLKVFTLEKRLNNSDSIEKCTCLIIDSE